MFNPNKNDGDINLQIFYKFKFLIFFIGIKDKLLSNITSNLISKIDL
jgi:hypothetical protein